DPEDLVGEVHVAVVAAGPELVDVVRLAHVLHGGGSEITGTEKRTGTGLDRVCRHVVSLRTVRRRSGGQDHNRDAENQNRNESFHATPPLQGSVISVTDVGPFFLRLAKEVKAPRSVLRLRAVGEGRMKIRVTAIWLLCLLGSAGLRADGPDPREANFRFFVDGVQISGVIGYRIEFARNPV